MTRFAFLFTGSAALALAACGGEAEEAADETTIIETETTEPAPVVTETTIVEDRTDGDDSLTISEDGVEAEIRDGDTEVTVDADGDPAVRVED